MGSSLWGLWSQAERLFHLNCLELIAGGFTLKSFVKHRRHIKVLMQTSASFMNKMGGHPLASSPPPPWNIKKWHFCLSRKITIPIAGGVQHLETHAPNISANTFALGPLEVDPFASRLTNQIPCYSLVSWKPDPGAEATDAFSLNCAQ